MNWYLYCKNNPLAYVDPSGRISTTELLVINAAKLIIDINDMNDLCDSHDCSDSSDGLVIVSEPSAPEPPRTIDLVMAAVDNLVPDSSGAPYPLLQIYRSVVEYAFDTFGIQRAMGWEAAGSAIMRAPDWFTGPVEGWLNDMYFEGEDTVRAFSYSGTGSGVNYGANARGVFAIGIDGATSKDWTAGKFHTVDISNGGIGLSGTIFVSSNLKWIGLAWGFGIGTPAFSIDEVEYEQK
jgi:hypothetical protein